MVRTAPYGSWNSPVTSDGVANGLIRFEQIDVDGEDIYWTEARPAESGRSVLVRRGADGKLSDATPPPFDVRTRVHEYGGGAFIVSQGTVYFSHSRDHRVYRLAPGGDPQPITPEGQARYADFSLDRARSKLICVREDHAGNDRHPVHSLVSVPLGTDAPPETLVAGDDFYAAPRVSPDGHSLAWLAWNHPDMPWDGTELWLGSLDSDGTVTNRQRIAGGRTESVFQPTWSPDGELYFASDRTGWWNLYRWRNGRAEALLAMEAEFGRPLWVLGRSTFAFDSSGHIISVVIQSGVERLVRISTQTRHWEEIATPHTQIEHPRCLPGRIVFAAASPEQAMAIVEMVLATGQLSVLRPSMDEPPEAQWLSVPERITFPSGDGAVAHGIFYRPRSAEYAGPRGSRPPLLVRVHGGPTFATAAAFDPLIQFWTTRGFAVLDVNYRGSAGFGKAYREALYGRWGIADVEDCVNGARFIVGRGDVDAGKVAIRGASAGGYTVLSAMSSGDTFQAGASYWGLSDLQTFVAATHKFEAHYLDKLIGPLPEFAEMYDARSPINHAEKMHGALILFQGLRDTIVPPAQAAEIVETLKARGRPVASVTFEREGHGLRRAENIKRALDEELSFYLHAFGIAQGDTREDGACRTDSAEAQA